MSTRLTNTFGQPPYGLNPSPIEDVFVKNVRILPDSVKAEARLAIQLLFQRDVGREFLRQFGSTPDEVNAFLFDSDDSEVLARLKETRIGCYALDGLCDSLKDANCLTPKLQSLIQNVRIYVAGQLFYYLKAVGFSQFCTGASKFQTIKKMVTEEMSSLSQFSVPIAPSAGIMNLLFNTVVYFGDVIEWMSIMEEFDVNPDDGTFNILRMVYPTLKEAQENDRYRFMSFMEERSSDLGADSPLGAFAGYCANYRPKGGM